MLYTDYTRSATHEPSEQPLEITNHWGFQRCRGVALYLKGKTFDSAEMYIYCAVRTQKPTKRTTGKEWAARVPSSSRSYRSAPAVTRMHRRREKTRRLRSHCVVCFFFPGIYRIPDARFTRSPGVTGEEGCLMLRPHWVRPIVGFRGALRTHLQKGEALCETDGI